VGEAASQRLSEAAGPTLHRPSFPTVSCLRRASRSRGTTLILARPAAARVCRNRARFPQQPIRRR
jgi:hypothetical protein